MNIYLLEKNYNIKFKCKIFLFYLQEKYIKSNHLGISCTVLNVTIALPIGVAVWLTLSLTSYAVILIFVSVVKPSLARKLTVVKKLGLLLR